MFLDLENEFLNLLNTVTSQMDKRYLSLSISFFIYTIRGITAFSERSCIINATDTEKTFVETVWPNDYWNINVKQVNTYKER